MSDFIITWDSYFRDKKSSRDNTIRKQLLSKGVVMPINFETDNEAANPEYQVNDGRWLVGCPDCGTWNLAREDEIFMCNNCGNARIKKKQRKAPFPANRREIERILVMRPMYNNRHWIGESIEQLITENKAHGDWEE